MENLADRLTEGTSLFDLGVFLTLTAGVLDWMGDFFVDLGLRVVGLLFSWRRMSLCDLRGEDGEYTTVGFLFGIFSNTWG